MRRFREHMDATVHLARGEYEPSTLGQRNEVGHVLEVFDLARGFGNDGVFGAHKYMKSLAEAPIQTKWIFKSDREKKRELGS